MSSEAEGLHLMEAKSNLGNGGPVKWCTELQLVSSSVFGHIRQRWLLARMSEVIWLSAVEEGLASLILSMKALLKALLKLTTVVVTEAVWWHRDSSFVTILSSAVALPILYDLLSIFQQLHSPVQATLPSTPQMSQVVKLSLPFTLDLQGLSLTFGYQASGAVVSKTWHTAWFPERVLTLEY